MSKKAKGFGQSQPATGDAKRLMLAFRACLAKAQGDQAQLDQFLQSNLDPLDESLLEALPLVFAALTANQPPTERQAVADLFWDFGIAIGQFPLGDRRL